MRPLLLVSLFACAPELAGPASLPVAQGDGPFAVPFTGTAVYPEQLATLSGSGVFTSAGGARSLSATAAPGGALEATFSATAP
jgi:hypothetical protein